MRATEEEKLEFKGKKASGGFSVEILFENGRQKEKRENIFPNL